MALSLRITDGTGRLDARVFRALLLSALGRTGDGIIACDEHLEVVFACPRATKLLERFGHASSAGLPERIVELVSEYREGGEVTLGRRMAFDGAPAVQVRVASLWGAPPVRTLVWVREEARRDDDLYAALRERYGLSRRAFQLTLLVRQGLRNSEIARELRLSEATVKVYLHNVYKACRVSSRTALVALMDQFRQLG